jgi:proteasome regulatory subunit
MIMNTPLKCRKKKYKSNMEETVLTQGGDSELTSKLKMQDLESQLLDQKVKNEELGRENAQLRRENNQLKRMPLFVAVVVDILEKGEVYLRQQGNNQEYITHVNDDIFRELKPGTKVAVNNALSIVRVVGNIFDSRVRVMEPTSHPMLLSTMSGPRQGDRGGREAVGIRSPSRRSTSGWERTAEGILLSAPGTGKTLIAKAVAHEARATFIRMSGSGLVQTSEKGPAGPALLPRTGESPSIVFIDEIDSGKYPTNDGTSAVPRCRGHSCSSWQRWTGSIPGGMSGSWPPPTGWICSTRPCCGPAGSTGSSRSLSPTPWPGRRS